MPEGAIIRHPPSQGETPLGVTVRQKPPNSGVWWIFISHQGQRRSKKVGPEDAARRLAEKVRERFALNLPPLERGSALGPSFSNAARAWLVDQERLVAQGKRSPTTLERGYRPIVEQHLIPSLGGMSAESIGRPEVVAYVERLAAQGLDGKTISNHLTPLSRIFERLRNRGHRIENPVLGLRLGDLAIERANRPGDPLSMRELSKLLQTVAKHYPHWLPHLSTLALAGLRYSEMLGLRWGDIQFGDGPEDAERHIMVKRAAIRIGGKWVVKGPKTGSKGEGRVDLHKDLRDILMAYQVEEIAAGRGDLDGWIFHGKRGGRVFRQKLVRDYRVAQHLVGLRTRQLKDLRHTFDSILLNELGEDIRYAQSQMRHATLAMTVDRYGHPDRLNDPFRVDKIRVFDDGN